MGKECGLERECTCHKAAGITNLSLVMHHATICRQADRSTAAIAIHRNRHAGRLVEDDLHSCALMYRAQRIGLQPSQDKHLSMTMLKHHRHLQQRSQLLHGVHDSMKQVLVPNAKKTLCTCLCRIPD